MSRKRYQAQAKRVQKMGRDGLVEQNKVTGEEQRISQRTADVSFAHERPQKQVIGRTQAPRNPKRRKQPRPAPSLEAVQSTDQDVSNTLEPTPPIRGAGDTPALAQVPGPVEDAGHSKKRRRRKQNSKLRQDAASRFSPEDGRLKFEDEAGPTDSMSVESGQRGDQKMRQRRKQEYVFQQDASVPESWLKFEDAPTPPAAGQERPHLHFEDEKTRTLEPDSASDTPPPSRRQRQRLEKAECRVEHSGRRLEKAQAKLPVKRRARLEKELDSDTGKVRHRLRFESEVKPEYASPSLPARIGRTAKMAAVMKLHSKIRENERDNTALEAAHKAEFAAERGAGRFLRWNRQRLRSKPYRAARQAERRLAVDRAELAWQTALRDHPELRRQGTLARWTQKQKLKRRYAQAAREAQKTARQTQEAATAVGKIARSVQRFAAAHKSAFLVAAMLVLVIGFFASGLASCTAMLSGVQSSFLSAIYLANEQDICNAELYFTELEANLQLNINNTRTNFPGYDEYRFSVGEISHNPYELMAYLSIAYGAFSYGQVKPTLDRLFAQKYQLTRSVVKETRYDENEQPYEVKVLKTTLTVRRWADMMGTTLTTQEQTDRYSAYMQTYGNRQAFGNPFDFCWLGYVSSGYGYRVHPTTGAKDLHRGVDIAATQGTAIKAIQAGRVVSAGNAGSYGLCVVIEDEKGYQSRYAHCSSLSVSAGQEVQRGDVIGAVGSTGNSTGPHLHLEVMLNGEYLNPYYFVDNGDDGSGGAFPGTPGGPVIPDYSGEPMGDDRFQAMLAVAEQYLGYPYVWGGTNPTTSFDCSGYVSWVINHSGWNYGRLGVMGLEDICTPVSAADAQPGDLVFFIGTYDAPYPNRPTHVGIYVGNGQMIHCGDPISYANLNTPYWQNHFYGFGRLPEP